MGCTLYLVRHGVAVDAGPGISDAERALTPEGGRKMTRAAIGLHRLGVRPDVILSSPLRRAEQTAERLRSVLTPDTAVEIFAPLAPGHEPLDVLKTLATYRGSQHIVLVGHQPDMGELAAYLVSGSSTLVTFDFKKGAVAAIAVTALPPRSPGLLRWFMTSKQLRALARR